RAPPALLPPVRPPPRHGVDRRVHHRLPGSPLVSDLGEQHTHEPATHEPQGRPPGVERGGHGSVLTYVVGLGFAIVLTLASFWASDTHVVWQPAVPVLLAALAIAQMGV